MRWQGSTSRLMASLSADDRANWDKLVRIIDEELRAQLGIGRDLQKIPPLTADVIWRAFKLERVQQVPGPPRD